MGPWELERSQNNGNNKNRKRNKKKLKRKTTAAKNTKSIVPKANDDALSTVHSTSPRNQNKPNSTLAKRMQLRTKWIYQNNAEYLQLMAAYMNAEARQVCIPVISDLYPPHRLISSIHHHPMNEYIDIQ